MTQSSVPQFRAATLGQRLLAGLIDAVPILSLTSTVAWGIIVSDPSPVEMPPWNLVDQIADYIVQRPWRAFGCLVALCGVWLGWGCLFKGATPGRRAMGLRWIDASGLSPSLKRVFLSMLLSIPLTLLGGLSFWWAWVDRERRSLSERLSGIWLISRVETRSPPSVP